jgi:hypothetical protein
MNWLDKILRPVIRGVAELSPSCREASRLQSLALDRPLSWRQRTGLRIHLVLCKWCRRYGKQLRFLRSSSQEAAQHESVLPAQTLRVEARERIKQRLNAQKQ